MHIRTFRHIASALIAAALLFAAPLVFAQGYPTKTIKFVVPFPAGSATDVVGRVLAEAMGKELGRGDEQRAGDKGASNVTEGANVHEMP